MDTRAHREPWQMQAGSPATLRLVAEDEDLSGFTLTVTPRDGAAITAAASDDDGARVFTLTGEQTAAIETAGGGTMSIRNAAGDEGIVGPVWASRTGTGSQDHTVTVSFGAAELALTLGAFTAGDGGGTGLPDGGTTGQILAKASGDDGDYEFVSRNAPNGYAGLDGDGTVPDNRIPSSIARDSEVAAAVDALDLADPGVWTLTRDAGLLLHPVHESHNGSATHVHGDEVVDEWGFPDYPDGDAGGFMRDPDGTLRHYHPSQGTTYGIGVTTVVHDDPFGAPRERIIVQGIPTTEEWDDIDWCSGGPIVDFGGGVGMMVLHVELNPPGGDTGGWVWWTLHVAKVEVVGSTRTVTYLGPFIQHALTAAEAESGGHRAFVWAGHLLDRGDDDGYVYFFHHDLATGAEYPHAAVSRALKADLAAAVTADAVPTCAKWNGEALDATWTEPGLGGDSASLPSFWIASGDVVDLPDGRILHLATRENSDADPDEWSIVSHVGSDPITWGPRKVVVGPQATGREWYAAIVWSGDAAEPKKATGPKVSMHYVESGYPTSGDRWGDYTVEHLDLRPVVEPVDPPDLSGYQTANLVGVTEPTSLAGKEPGLVFVSAKDVPVEMPPSGTANPNRPWWFVNGTAADPGGFTITAAPGDNPINFVGDLTVPAGDMAIAFPVGGGLLWVVLVVPTAAGAAIGALDGRIDTLEERPLVVSLTESEYAALDPVDPDTIYVVVPDP